MPEDLAEALGTGVVAPALASALDDPEVRRKMRQAVRPIVLEAAAWIGLAVFLGIMVTRR